MKSHIITISLLFASVAIGANIALFGGWDDLIERSPYIFIAVKPETNEPVKLDSAGRARMTAVLDGITVQRVDIISNLKGDAKLGTSIVLMPYRPEPGGWPHPGNMFLIFANDREEGLTNSPYKAIEDYRMVMIANADTYNAWKKLLDGKPLKEQIQIILEHRLGYLKYEMEKDQEEKRRMENGLKELGQTPSTK